MKQRVEELIFSIKDNFIYYLSSIIILTSITFLLGTTIIFMNQVSQKANDVNTIYHGKAMYRIIDNFYEGNDFSEFTSDINNVNKVSDFYNKLNENESIRLLSVFTQNLYIDKFKGSNEFLEDLKESDGTPAAVKSIQMNKDSFDFYKVELESGVEINWESIKDEDKTIPVILGSNYKNVYSIGDKIKVNYYPKLVEIEVVGFMKVNTSIYYQGNPEFYLDSYILVPYPWQTGTILNDNKVDEKFKSILYFAMINSDLTTTLSENELLYTIDKISYESKFFDHKLVGNASFSLGYAQMNMFIKTNGNLLLCLLIFFIIFSIIIQISISQIIIRRRENIYKLYKELGTDMIYSDIKMVLLFPYIVSFVIAIILLIFYFRGNFLHIILSALLLLCITNFICRKYLLLINKHL